MLSRRRVAVIACSILLGCGAQSYAQTKQPAAPAASPAKPAQPDPAADIQKLMDAKTSEERLSAAPQIRRLLEQNPGLAVQRLADQWLVRFMESRQYSLVEELSASACQVSKDPVKLGGLHSFHVQAMIAQERHADAAAKIKSMSSAYPERVLEMLAARGPRATLQLFLDAGKYEIADELIAAALAPAAKNTDRLQSLLMYRVQLLLAQEKPQEALVASKQLFNVCRMDATKDSIRLVSEALNAAYPKDRDILRRFRAEQTAGAEKTQRPSPDEKTILSEIQIDPKSLDAAIRMMRGEDFGSLVGRGNLLLLAGRTDEAWDVFERAYAVSADAELVAASENLARCMRAQDGGIGRANAWVLSIRPAPKEKATTAPSKS